ncbi:N-acetyltransferase [Sphingomonas sp. S1-29]|uniref:GNAT family N-acetyltransferase n=1 Tax=Sphingomonas sp. S1-29 TaxID=2991074 RepID=UPI00223EDF52|nr:N-acetyltransferase [Sphingomonas sp. S1-29]UZK69229.1 N-acetyltransferase [Sphingomonas sp. S1-29]
MADLIPIAEADQQAIETLLDSVFGTDRHQRTAYRLRDGVAAIPELSFAAVEDGQLVGSIQCWPVELAADSGARIPMILVGPIAVSPLRQDVGIGRALTHRAIAVAQQSDIPGGDSLMLIGDPDYYGRFFGFGAERTGQWRLPGPFESHRLLALGSDVPMQPGHVGPRIGATVQRRLAGGPRGS